MVVKKVPKYQFWNHFYRVYECSSLFSPHLYAAKGVSSSEDALSVVYIEGHLVARCPMPADSRACWYTVVVFLTTLDWLLGCWA